MSCSFFGHRKKKKGKQESTCHGETRHRERKRPDLSVCACAARQGDRYGLHSHRDIDQMDGCAGCGSVEMLDDIATGDVVCTACGWIAHDDRVYRTQSSCLRPRSKCAARGRRAFARAESLLCRAAHAVAPEFGIDPALLLIEATRTGIPEDVRGPVDVALCRAVARLCGDGGDARQMRHCA
nr:hypothetical protein [Pandoravirus massiliensis]